MKGFFALIGALALLLGVAVGGWWHFADAAQRANALERVGLRQSPLKTAETSLEALQERRELTVQSARFLSRMTTSRDLTQLLPKGLLTSSKTLIVSGTVRYMLDLSKLRPEHLAFDSATRTLSIKRPPLLVSEPQFHVQDMSEMQDGRVLMWLTGSEPELDAANWAKANAAVRSEAQSSALVKAAGNRADEALADLFRLPLVAAGFDDISVVVTA